VDVTPLKTARLPSLDGWRAVSIIIVLAAHSRYAAGFPASLDHPVDVLTNTGSLGVRFFFLISGFLITWLLLLENAANGGLGVNLKHFYIRRVLRIFPVYFFFLAVLAGLSCVTSYHQGLQVWLANLTFTTNIFGGGSDGVVSRHLWSLAIEEQFYLFWPGTFLMFGLASKTRRYLWILSVPILLGPISRIMVCKHYYPSSLNWYFSFFPTTSFMDSIAIGCGCALLLFQKHACVTRWLRQYSARLPLAGLALLAIPMLMEQFHLPARLIALCGHTLQAMGFAILLLDSVLFPGKKYYQWLNLPVMRHLGMLSYSIYIWQQLFFMPAQFQMDPHTWWMSFPWWLLPTLVVAHLSYYALEMPFFRLRKRFGVPAR
jgi:peptidoglycan/LPS O-acetylase OafA/YrhL